MFVSVNVNIYIHMCVCMCLCVYVCTNVRVCSGCVGRRLNLCHVGAN